MNFSNSFLTDVKNNDVIGVRSIILRQLNNDKTLVNSIANDMCDYAISKNVNLFETDNNDTSILPKSAWNKELWQDLRIKFEYNFSKEKFDYIQNIMSYLRENNDPEFMVKPASTSKDLTHLKTAEFESAYKSKPIPNLFVGVICGAIIGGVISKGGLLGIIGGVIVGGFLGNKVNK